MFGYGILARYTFYRFTKNSVTAVIRSEHAKLFQELRSQHGEDCDDQSLVDAGIRIFTFSDREDLQEFVTGKTNFMENLLELHECIETDRSWGGYVPFSEGPEKARENEMMWKTTPADLEKAFTG